jgi:hypothetical protein
MKLNENEKKYKCKTSILYEGDLERLAYAEVSRDLFEDMRIHQFPQFTFLVGFCFMHGNVFGKTYDEVRDKIMEHLSSHKQCKKVYEGLLEKERKAQWDFLKKKGIDEPLKKATIENGGLEYFKDICDLVMEYSKLRFPP